MSAEHLEEFNSAFVKKLLAKNPRDFLSWLQRDLVDNEPTIEETLFHADRYDGGDLNAKGSLDLGLRILDGDFELYRFLIGKLRSKLQEPPESATNKPKLDVRPDKRLHDYPEQVSQNPSQQR